MDKFVYRRSRYIYTMQQDDALRFIIGGVISILGFKGQPNMKIKIWYFLNHGRLDEKTILLYNFDFKFVFKYYVESNFSRFNGFPSASQLYFLYRFSNIKFTV